MSGVIVPFSTAFTPAAARVGRGFISFKTSAPIPYTQRCARDALIQASLEPEITSVEPLQRTNIGPADTYFAFAVVTQGHRCAIALTDQTNCTSFTPPDGYDAAIAINRASILADPVKTTARTIWSHRDTLVPPLFSVRVMRRLKENLSGQRLGDLEEDLVHEPKNWVAYTLAMACNGLVIVDYRSPITDETVVRVNPASQSHARQLWRG